MAEKKKYKFVYIGKIVVRDGEKDGRKYSYSMLQLGNRHFKKDSSDAKFKAGDVIPPVTLTDKQKAKLLDQILDKDLYLFDPNDDAPDFIKKYVAVKTEDLEDGEDL